MSSGRKLRILVITQIYLPEMGALSNRLYPIIQQLVEAGHEVTLATGMPNYPTGKVFANYRGKLFADERKDGYRILRTAYYTTPRNLSKIKQILSYISFMPAVFLSGIRAGKSDLVLITSPPIFPLLPAILLSKLRGAKLAFDVRDLWSDELVTFGGMSEDSVAVRIARKLENWGYRVADLVSATTKSLVQTAIERGAPTKRTIHLPNGADTKLFRPYPRNNDVAQNYEFGDRFVVMYSGLFGLKHGLESFLGAAKILRNRKDIVFFLLGNGARRLDIEEFIEQEALENVIIGDEVNVKDVPKLIAAADVCFASFTKSEYTKQIISVKVFEYLACKKPVVGAFEGESARVIEESNGGIVVPPNDPEAIADAIRQIHANTLGGNKSMYGGRSYVEENYSRAVWARRFEKELSGLFDDPVQTFPPKEDEGIGLSDKASI